MAAGDLWVVIDRRGEVQRVYDSQQRGLDYVSSLKGATGCGVVLVGSRHPQYERLARYEIGFVLEGYEPEPA
jgi:hypothetical protein